MIGSVASLGVPAAVPARGSDDPKKIHDAAQQFEALLIGQLLKTSREAGGSGWLGTGDDEAGETGLEMAEQQFAQMLAQRGGLGLARLVESGLRRGADAQSTTSSPPPPGPGGTAEVSGG